MKIHYLGIRGKCYKFIIYWIFKYLSSKACVKADGQLSESFSTMKGNLQGGPFSPIFV